MQLEGIQIRETEVNDHTDIFKVEEQAFGYDKEANLTDALLHDQTGRPIISLLAFHNTKAIGHILFTRAYIDEKINQPLLHILAPLAVKPAFQKQGIGGLLIQEGLKRLKQIGSELVFVLGHIEYYPQFGFIPDAEKLGFPAPYPIPAQYANAWMVQSLHPQKTISRQGKVICADTLNKPEHWRE